MDKSTKGKPVAARTQAIIAVVPLGDSDGGLLQIVADSLQGVLRLPVDLKSAIPLPEDSFVASRGQYNAMAIIKHLAEVYADGYLKVIGITAQDLANPILTYVFGEAYMNGVSAVMSSFRLWAGTGNQTVSREHFLERAVKVAIHEIGHTFNIPHCHTDRCVMRSSHNLIELDQKLNYMCGYCELFLAEALTKALKEHPTDLKRQETA